MKYKNDYLSLLKKQCDCILSGGSNSEKVFEDICLRLEKDFLPPIEREDIASISMHLLDISRLSENKKINAAIKKRIDLIARIIEELLNKKKTCGENIRRLIALNSEFRAETLNEEKIDIELKSLTGRLNEAYFRNL